MFAPNELNMEPSRKNDNMLFKLPSVSRTKYKSFIDWCLGTDIVNRQMKCIAAYKGSKEIREYLSDGELINRINEKIIEREYTEIISIGVIKFRDKDTKEFSRAVYMELQKPTPKNAQKHKFEDSQKIRYGKNVIHFTAYEIKDGGPYVCTMVKSKIKTNIKSAQFFEYAYVHHRLHLSICNHFVTVLPLAIKQYIDVKLMLQHLYFFTSTNAILLEKSLARNEIRYYTQEYKKLFLDKSYN